MVEENGKPDEGVGLFEELVNALGYELVDISKVGPGGLSEEEKNSGKGVYRLRLRDRD